jgi:hypothetical protein
MRRRWIDARENASPEGDALNFRDLPLQAGE